jgi:hypothetical protein
MSNKPRTTKPRHIPILLRDVPIKIHQSIKRIATKRGVPMRSMILEAIRREIERDNQLEAEHEET